MSNYSPLLLWRDQTRAMDAKCQDCGRELTDTSIAAVRSHLMAWPGHTMRVATVVTTLITRHPKLAVANE